MTDLTRRDALKILAATGTTLGVGCKSESRAPASISEQEAPDKPAQVAPKATLKVDTVIETSALSPGTPWPTRDPFLFCVYHDDAYPAGNEKLGPAVSLAGRDLGQDFAGLGGWRMYHGKVVPGFPSHPHRGFETVTVVRRGLLDHSDSLGAKARYGGGDVQWLTAGRGIQHAEMFPLLKRDGPNPLELFQIWLNLPKASKMATPYFSMLWNEQIPTVRETGPNQEKVELRVIAGTLPSAAPPSPPPDSWAAESQNDVAIWTIKLAPNATWTAPPAQPGTSRSLYFFSGERIRVGTRDVSVNHRIDLKPDLPSPITNLGSEVEILLLQGKPIAEPISRYGPFVMNTRDEIRQAFSDYRRTRFGGWPWDRSDPVHGTAPERFAHYQDGRIDRPKS